MSRWWALVLCGGTSLGARYGESVVLLLQGECVCERTCGSVAKPHSLWTFLHFAPGHERNEDPPPFFP